jgi:hypothetical protein
VGLNRWLRETAHGNLEHLSASLSHSVTVAALEIVTLFQWGTFVVNRESQSHPKSALGLLVPETLQPKSLVVAQLPRPGAERCPTQPQEFQQYQLDFQLALVPAPM